MTIVMICFGIEAQNDIGISAGLAGTTRLLFGAIATAVFSNIPNSQYGKELSGYVSNAVTPLGFSSENLGKLTAAAQAGTAAAYKAVPGITPIIQTDATKANYNAYLKGSQVVFYVALALGFIASVAAFFTVSIDPRKYTRNTFAVQETEYKVGHTKDTPSAEV